MYRKRRIFGLQIWDYWFDDKQFINTKSSLSILRSDKKLRKKYYSFKLLEKTYKIDLRQDKKEIFSKFKKKSAQYSIKKAKKCGVKIIIANTKEEKMKFRQFLDGFAKNMSIPAFALDESLDPYSIFNAYSQEDEYLGGVAFIHDTQKKTFRYKYGATSYKYNENDLLIWKAILFAKKNNYLFFDLGGVPIVKSPENEGRFKFKEKFGGDLVDFYTYIKVKKTLIPLLYTSNFIVFLFFKNDYNKLFRYLKGLIK